MGDDKTEKKMIAVALLLGLLGLFMVLSGIGGMVAAGGM